MPGGQAITSAPGVLVASGSDPTVFVSLRSRKDGTGTANWAMQGQSGSSVTGSVWFEKSVLVAGQLLTSSTETVLYHGRMTISWAANAESDLAGYRIWRGTSPTDVAEIINVGNVTTYDVGGLLPGLTHYFVVTAYDTAGNESGLSAQVSKVF